MKPANYPQSPSHLWEHFYQFSQIPRPSKAEARIREYVIAEAERCGMPWKSDAMDNIVIYVPGTHGMESSAPVVIQNHVDMVTVKTDDKEHDFHTDPLQLEVVDGWLKADRTTLGADNGIGCAAALALMSDSSVVHPPLELLFTMDEETGLGGALNLDASLLSGKRMLNLDTEDWGELFIGCAGGRGWDLRRNLETESLPDGHVGAELVINGLAGGHSGVQIHQQLGSAIKLAAQWLHAAAEQGVRLASFNAGVAHNVIPREAVIRFSCPAQNMDALQAVNEAMMARWQSYLPKVDAGLQISIEACELDSVLAVSAHQQLVQLLSIFPHGAQTYNFEQPADLVDLSINLALVQLDGGALRVLTSVRFFNEAEAEPLFDKVLMIGDVFGLEREEILNYPGWIPDFGSDLLAQAKSVYEELHGAVPEVKAIHAGLECGILKSKMGEVDIISFGPTIRGAHSPTERLEIATVEPFWALLTRFLQRL